MADFVTPRHSAVMERLRRRIEHFRQHHNSCESRYDTATLERLEHERQQTFNLHRDVYRRKRSGPTSTGSPRAVPGSRGSSRPLRGTRGPARGCREEPGRAPGRRGEWRQRGGAEPQQHADRAAGDGEEEAGERRLPGNGFSDGFPPNKKACLDNTGSPLDSKLGLSDVLNANGNHGNNNNTDPRDPTDFHRKE
ncbi:hypothetical protein F7725_010672 [Dissostichus mawsoni]|uniref:Neurogenic mastermind-like N-terminal domain-containing protein n=1 Tax=Dissostichus mawsoni TaxID=36200 RepID=A0A7J5XP84_DISMA|nr:hypothetical protein F7725_010672 [Dissostichus mawsoni]